MTTSVTINGNTYIFQTDFFGSTGYEYLISFPAIVSDVVTVAGQVASNASSASTSASTATTQAGIATTQATNASNSASAAAASAASIADMRYFTTAGTANTYTGNLTPDTTLTDGNIYKVKIHTACTGASTLNIDGLGAKAIRKEGGAVLASGDLATGQQCLMIYDSANDRYNLLTLGGNTAAMNITGLAAVTTLDDGDEVALYDSSAAANKKITKQNIIAQIGAEAALHGAVFGGIA